MTIGAPTLSVRGLCKNYGALKAVSDMNFDIGPGEILGIGGPNGAGKTTLFDLISGITLPSSGQVIWDGDDIAEMTAADICHRGICRTFQLNAAFETLSVFENTLCAAYFGANNVVVPGAFFPRKYNTTVADILDYVGLNDYATTAARNLPVLQRKLLMIASALVTQPRIIMLDEPVGGLNAEETDRVLQLLQKIHRDFPVSMIVIEHVMRFLVALSTRVIIMHRGSILYEGDSVGMAKDPMVISVYLGEKAANAIQMNLQGGTYANPNH